MKFQKSTKMLLANRFHVKTNNKPLRGIRVSDTVIHLRIYKRTGTQWYW